MTDPTDRFAPGPGPDPLERELRRSLAAHAADAPDAQALTERLLAVGAEPGHARHPGVAGPPRGWRTWGTPLVAAACVAAIVGIVLAVVAPGHSGHGPDAVDTPSLAVPSVTTSTPTQPSTAVPAPSKAAPIDTRSLHDVTILDLTFDTENHGWALASADCIRDPSRRCTALLRTTDGSTWSSHPGIVFDVPGVNGCPPATCVTNIRFADDENGYAFGPDVLFMTTDGAKHWTRVAGGAYALETLDNDVIRLVGSSSGCPGPCNLRVETSSIGSPVWRTVALSATRIDAATVNLWRTGRSAFVQVTAGNEGSAHTSVIYASANDGASWSTLPSPCASVADADLDGEFLATAADGSLSVLCAQSMAAQARGQASFVRTSSDGGATFGAPVTVTGSGVVASAAHGDGIGVLGAASARVLVGYGVGGLYRSSDGGHSWRRVAHDTSDGNVLAPGFESSSVGRWVSPDAQTIWLTRNAGATWKAVHLP